LRAEVPRPAHTHGIDDWRIIMETTQADASRVTTQFLTYSLILATLAVFIAGCAAPYAGRLQSNPQVTEVFKRSRILPDHQYYVSGFQRVPYAIIAVDNKYQLQAGRWQPIDMDSTALNQLIYRMEHVYSLNPRGAWILDQDGNRLGAWYSSQYQTLVKREKDNRIVVANPDPPDLRGIP
jgi:hypothetical protein